jgi:hypothetical protein
MTFKMIPLGELALFAGTRAALGAGVGLLAAQRRAKTQRRMVGWTLLTVGRVTTYPLLIVLSGHMANTRAERTTDEDKGLLNV